jgi:predicted metalloprotease with PDZ domain
MRRYYSSHPDTPLIKNLIDRTLEISGVDLRAEVGEFVDRGATVPLDTELLGPCLTVEAITMPLFERGYDPVATQRAGGVVTGLDPNSNAYAAGLRDGMRLLKRTSGTIGDATQPLRFEVESEGRTSEISWLPQGAKTESFRRLNFLPVEAQSCAALLG